MDWGGGEGGQSTIAAKSKRGVEFHSLICFVTGFPRPTPVLMAKIGGRLGEQRELYSATAGGRHETFPIVLDLTFIASIILKPQRGEKYLNKMRIKGRNDSKLPVRCHARQKEIK